MALSQAASNFLICVDLLDAKYQELEEALYARLVPTSYALPMFAGVAVAKSNAIVDHNPRYASADHGANFQCLLTCIRKAMEAGEAFAGPYFDGVLQQDPHASAILQYESARTYVRHMRSSVTNDLWVVEEPSPRQFRIRLAAKHQRSALHLLSAKAQYLRSSASSQAILSGERDSKESGAPLMLAMRFDDLAALTEGVGKEWTAFLDAIGITETTLLHFLAVVSEINANTYRLWFRKGALVEALESFEETNGLPASDRLAVENTISHCSASVEEATAWGLAVPFVTFSDWYLRWPFAFHVLHPGLAALAILMKRGQKEWDKTVGAQSAKVAYYISNQLQNFRSLILCQCRIKKGVGDIDIGMFDPETGNIMLCEVKTVFDRFRTNHQLSNFVEQRVNYDKAVKQLRATEHAIKAGDWQIKDIFGIREATPSAGQIFKVVLTWWDIFDPFKGTEDSEIASSNFDTFVYLYNEAKGDLAALHTSLRELSTLACVTHPRDDYTEIDDLRFDYRIDAQTDILPPGSHSSRQSLSALSQQVIADLASMPEDWREQVTKSGDDPDNWIM